MLEEFKKSISDIFYERLSSPLYGSFIISWLLWNWKIPYVTLFVDSSKLDVNKIEYIVREAENWTFLILYPVLSTIILIVVIPFFATGAFWISLWYDSIRRDIKNKIENKQLLTLEQSIEIKEEVRRHSERYAQILSDKDEEIASMKSLLEAMQINNKPSDVSYIQSKKEDDSNQKYRKEYKELSQKAIFTNNFQSLIRKIQDGNVLTGERNPSQALTFFNANDIIAKSGNTGMYDFTEKGRMFLKYWINETS